MSEFRPNEIGLLFGQEHIQEVLAKWVEDPAQIPKSLLLAGPYGCGKTSIARMLAAKLASTQNDITEINAAEARGIDDVREWAESTRFSPFGKAKVYVIDELHQMTQAAQSALLKVIEEPPPGIYFFLCTTEPSKLLPAIRSRCTALEVKLLTLEATTDLLGYLSKGKIDAELCSIIHSRSGGHARDAVKAAVVALQNGVLDPIRLEQTLGINFTQSQQLINHLVDGNRQPQDSKVFVPLLQISDERFLAQLVDTAIDQAAMQGNPKVIQHYTEFLSMRVYRKEYKVTAREQALHAIARLS